MSFRLGLGFALALLLWVDGASAMTVWVDVGSQQRLTFPEPVVRISVGAPEVADVTTVGEREFLLLGKAVGATDLIVWFASRENVYSYRVVVHPNVDQVTSIVRSDPDFRDVRILPGQAGVILQGTVDNQESLERLRTLVSAYFPENVTEDVEVLQDQMVKAEIRFASVSTSAIERLGFDFSYLGNAFQFAVSGPGSIARAGGATLGSNGLPIADAFNLLLASPDSDISSVLGILSAVDMAQVLAEPVLTVRNGQTAEFLVGGEIPIPVPRGEDAGVSIEYKQFGIQLKLAATILSPKKILLTVSPEVSDLDFSRGVILDGVEVPAISRRSASTTVELGEGESLVLAGLLSSSTTDSDSGVPYLADVPVLGAFFSRRAQERKREELIISITPRLARPSAGQKEEVAWPDQKRQALDMLLNRKPVREHMIRYGLMP